MINSTSLGIFFFIPNKTVSLIIGVMSVIVFFLCQNVLNHFPIFSSGHDLALMSLMSCVQLYKNHVMPYKNQSIYFEAFIILLCINIIKSYRVKKKKIKISIIYARVLAICLRGFCNVNIRK